MVIQGCAVDRAHLSAPRLSIQDLGFYWVNHNVDLDIFRSQTFVCFLICVSL
jgi:hypothetical protein